MASDASSASKSSKTSSIPLRTAYFSACSGDALYRARTLCPQRARAGSILVSAMSLAPASPHRSGAAFSITSLLRLGGVRPERRHHDAQVLGLKRLHQG